MVVDPDEYIFHSGSVRDIQLTADSSIVGRCRVDSSIVVVSAQRVLETTRHLLYECLAIRIRVGKRRKKK